jgi:mRNA-degrading endonuclease toxin of MazEF toxin-antitoxin module
MPPSYWGEGLQGNSSSAGPFCRSISPRLTSVECTFEGKHGQVVLDQIRTVDKARLVKRIGRVSKGTQEAVLSALAELFAP